MPPLRVHISICVYGYAFAKCFYEVDLVTEHLSKAIVLPELRILTALQQVFQCMSLIGFWRGNPKVEFLSYL